MAEILVYPLHRRRDFVQRQAAWFCDQQRQSAESNLRYQLMVQRGVMLRRGVDPIVIEREIDAVEAAIRDEAVKLVFSPKGAS